MATSNFFVAETDGWVLVATDPGFLRVSTQTGHKWSYAIAGSTPALSEPGTHMPINAPLVINEPFTGNVYVRVQSPAPGFKDGVIRFDVTDLDVTGGGGGGGGGDASAANQSTQITAANLTNTNLGGVTETAPTTDTASSGLNGRLQRIAQRLTSLITAVGSPFQAGGSIGNTSFAATQATASNLNAQVVGGVARAVSVSGNPVLEGGRGKATAPTAVTADQIVDAWCGLSGNRVVTLSDIGGTLVMTTANGADGLTNNGTFYQFRVRPELWNNATWDRSRSITGALADGTGLGVAAVEQAGSLFNNITTATTTTVKSGKGILHKIVINTYAASATITIYDNTAASGTKIGTLTLPSTITGDTPITLPYDLQFSTGLTIVTSGATDLTVIYR